MALTVKTLPVGQLETNCYLLIDDDSQKGVIIDPGDDATYISQKILDERISLDAIIATHGHFDHVLAIQELKLAFEVPFLMHSKDLFLLKRMRETAQKFVGFDPGPPPQVDEYLDDVTSFGFGSTRLTMYHTPGHTPGSVSLYDRLSHTLFVGDVLFAQGGFGRTDFAYCSKNDLLASVQKLFQLPDQTLAYAGHGQAFYLADEALSHGITKYS